MEKTGGAGSGGVATPRWSLHVFGGFRLSTISGASVTLPGKRERILLAYLLLSPNCRQPRRKLADLLWGDTPDEAGLHNLRTCVWGLRNALSDPERRLLISEGEEIALDAGMFDVDAWTFRHLALEPERQALETAASLYAGAFLDGLSIDSEEFESWRRAEATYYRDQAIDVLTRLMTKLSGGDEAESAIRIGQRILALDPMHEVAVRQLMRLYADVGRRGAAVQLYQSLGRVLRAELNTEPEPETRQIFAELTRSQPEPKASATHVDKDPEGPPIANRPTPSRTPKRAGSSAAASHRRILGWPPTFVRSTGTLVALLAVLSFSHFMFVSPTLPDDTSTGAGPTKSPISGAGIDPGSQRQYLRAKALVRGRSARRGLQPLIDAADLLEQVTARHPDYAPAWALLARAYELTPALQLAGNPEDVRRTVDVAFRRAEAAAKRAIRIDPNSADAYLALGTVQQRRGNLVEAEELFASALQKDPNNADVLDQYSGLLAEVGRLREALAMQQQLQALESFVPIYNVTNARFLWLNGQNDTAIATFKTLLNGWQANVAKVYASMGRYSEAADLLREAAAVPNAPNWMDDAVQLLRTAPTESSLEDLPALGLTESYIYAYVGVPDRVLEPYEQIAETGYAPNVYIAYVGLLWHPAYASVRRTERFKAFARKIGLVEYWRAKGWPELCRRHSVDDFFCD